MVSERTLDLAVAQAIITIDQAARLRALDAPVAAAAATPVDPEALRFVSGFGDIFVTLGIGLFLTPAGYFANLYGGALARSATIAVLAWLLAELFTRRLRMALPSIVLLIVFVVSGFFAALSVFAAGATTTAFAASWLFAPLASLANFDRVPVLEAALVSAVLACLHYLRFRVPITIAAGAAALCVAIVTAAALLAPGLPVIGLRGVLLACGVLVFLIAMRFDLSDPERATRRTDIAFWLHLLAAPLIVHSLIKGFLNGLGPLDAPHAVGVLSVFLGLGVVAVVIDRRALLVSGLVYAGFAFSELVKATAFGDALVPVTVMTLGAFVLALSAGWRPLRRAFLLCLPASLSRRLPHPLVAAK
jgi:hypothetical protein